MTKLRELLNPALQHTFRRLGTGELYRKLIREINNAPIPQITTHYNKKHQLVKVIVSVFNNGKKERKEYQPVYDEGKLTLFYVGYYYEDLTIEEFIERYSYKQ